MLSVKADGGFEARLFVDTKSALPLMLVYQAPVPRMRMVQGGPGAGAAGGHGEPGAGGAPELAEARLFVSDFREVGGLRLPFAASQSIAGGPSEEWKIASWKLDPKLDPATFRRRK